MAVIGQDRDRTLEITNEPTLGGDRFTTLVDSLPDGVFYFKSGVVIPNRASVYDLTFTAIDAPSRTFAVIVGGVQTRTILTNSSGVVTFSDLIPGPGNIVIRIEDSVEVGRALQAFLAVTNYGLLDAAEAAVTEEVDGDITDVQEDSFLGSVDVADIQQKFGQRIDTQRVSGWNVDTYREVINELFQNYDIFSGTERGLGQAVGALTQVPPFSYDRRDFGPRWILGFQYLRNNEFALDSDSDGSPDDWLPATGGMTLLIDTAGVGLTNLFANQRLEVTVSAAAPQAVYSKALPIFSTYLGFEWTFTAWVESTGAFSLRVGISDDGGSTWTEGSPVVTTTSPQFIFVKKFVDPSATELRVRVRGSSAPGSIWFIERTALFVQGVTALYLGDATIPRSVRTATLGRAMVWWSPDVLTDEEMELFGLTNFIDIVNGGSGNVGHVDITVPAHTVVQDRDVTLRTATVLTIAGVKIVFLRSGMSTGTGALDWDTSTDELSWREPGEAGLGTPVNITQDGLFVIKNVAGSDSIVVSVDFSKLGPAGSATDPVDVDSLLVGTIDNADWVAGLTRINLDIVSRTPDRFSHLVPSVVSSFTETVIFNPSTSEATLSFESTQDQLQAVLLEDGISVPADDWSFVDSTTIDVASLDTSAEYVFTYEVLMEFETEVLDLGANWSDFTWVVDSYLWERFEKNVGEVEVTQELLFSTDTLQAELRVTSDEDKETGSITQTLGGLETVIPQSNWQYVDGITVQISGTQFSANATYVITYNAQKLQRDQVPRFEFFVASSTDGISFGSFTQKSRGDVIDVSANLRYHKIKINVFDVLDVRDVRVKSLVLKGVPIINDSIGL